MKKKLVSIVLSSAMLVSVFAGCGDSTTPSTESTAATTATTAETTAETTTETTSETTADAAGEVSADLSEYKLAMVTDYGDITDQSFNQTTYEACQAFAGQYGLDFQYFKPADNSTAGRVEKIEEAIDNGFNVIVMPGYAFGGSLVEVSESYPDVKFIALDVAAGDILEAGVAAKGETYDYNPDNWNLTDYCYMDNVYCAIYQEELSGYMAGYAAVMLGYKDLGFLGGMAVPAVIRYGYGFVQGADAAAAAIGADDVNVKYVYGNQFYGDADITAYMDTWYSAGTEVVFACGGGIYTSAAEAAVKVDGKVIGVDVDQAANIDGAFGEGVTVTSAMKGLYPTTFDTLTDVLVNGNWSNYAGKITTLGLVSQDPEANYVQIPMESTQWSDSFTQDDYKALVADMYSGVVTVSNDIAAEPEVSTITVKYEGNIK